MENLSREEQYKKLAWEIQNMDGVNQWDEFCSKVDTYLTMLLNDGILNPDGTINKEAK